MEWDKYIIRKQVKI